MSLQCGSCALWGVDGINLNGYKICGFFGRMCSSKFVCPADKNIEKFEKSLMKAKAERIQRDEMIKTKGV